MVGRGITRLRRLRLTGSQPASTISSSPPSFAQSSSDTPAVVRDGVWHLRTSNSSGIAHTQFRYGNSGDTPLIGDWDSSGSDSPAVVRGNTWYLRYSTTGTADITSAYGNVGDIPLSWHGDFLSCLSAEQGYQIGYPPGWHANTANGLPPCSVFDPSR